MVGISGLGSFLYWQTAKSYGSLYIKEGWGEGTWCIHAPYCLEFYIWTRSGSSPLITAAHQRGSSEDGPGHWYLQHRAAHRHRRGWVTGTFIPCMPVKHFGMWFFQTWCGSRIGIGEQASVSWLELSTIQLSCCTGVSLLWIMVLHIPQGQPCNSGSAWAS